MEFKIVIEEESIRDLFESMEVKFSKAKSKTIKEIIDDNPDLLETAVMEIIENIINDEF